MKRAAILIGAFLLLGARAHAELPANRSTMGIVAFAYNNGMQPELGVSYPLDQTTPFQKVDGGYLIVSAFNDGSSAPWPVFLKTKKDYSEGQILKGWAKCIGKIQLNGLNGFPQVFFAFELYGDRP